MSLWWCRLCAAARERQVPVVPPAIVRRPDCRTSQSPTVSPEALSARRCSRAFRRARDPIADIDAIVQSHHHDDERRLGGRDRLADDLRPILVFVAGVVADQTGGRAILAHHREIGRIAQRILKTVGQPVGHGIAQHQHIAAARLNVELARRRRAAEVDRPLLARRRERTEKRVRTSRPGRQIGRAPERSSAQARRRPRRRSRRAC